MSDTEIHWYDYLVFEWDCEKNEKHISEYSQGSHKKTWWKCKEHGHSYENTIRNRYNRGDNCPYCSGRRFLEGFNDLETKYPDLAKEFDIEKNEIPPSKIYPSKSDKVWWVCNLGHSYKTSFGNKINGTMCPFCTNRKIIAGFNDLATTHPEVAKEWDFSKNALLPTEVTYGSTKSVWWKCNLGHEWKTTISKRQIRNCPYCSNQKILTGYNDLATIYPQIAAEWNYERNEIVKPTMVSPATPKSYWWKCLADHEWKTSVNSRTGYKTNCPYCSQVRILTGFNDLLTLYPELVATSWDYEKNNLLKIYPDQIAKSSNVKVWWKCLLEHSWNSSVKIRIAMDFDGCIYCNNRKVLKGFNDLETIFPALLNEWKYEKNKQKPSEYTYKSMEKVWWKCQKGHSWKTSIYTRTVLKSQCLRCSNGKHSSEPESKLMEYLEEEYGEITTHTREIISPYELDIYISELNLAIEFNGLYWHSEEKGKDKEYHYNKWKKCDQLRINLITVWEDDWKQNSEIIKQKIKVVLNKEKFAKQGISTDKNHKSMEKTLQYSTNKNNSEYIFDLHDKKSSIVLGSISGIMLKNKKVFKISDYTPFADTYVLRTMIEEISKTLKCDNFEYKISNDNNYFKKELDEVFAQREEIEPSYKVFINSKRYDKTDILVCRYLNADPNVKINKVWDSGSQLYTLTLHKEI